MELQTLNGKTIVDIIKQFPAIEWHCQDGTSRVRVPFGKVTLVQYDTEKPVKSPDFVFRVRPALVGALAQITPTGKSLGLASLVSYEDKTYHLPILDLDAHGKLDFLDDAQLMEVYKTAIKCETELDSGVFLRSGPKRNFHFLGLGRLLTPDQYITFLGLALTMKYEHSGEGINLVDSRNIGHSLTRFAHRAELDKSKSRYDCNEKFSTLRITPKEGYAGPPAAVDFLRLSF